MNYQNSTCSNCGELQQFNTYEQICYKCGHSEDDLVLHELAQNETNETNAKTYCLFNRHELPANLGAICEGFDFQTFEVKKSPFWKDAVLAENCEIIVTGLTPALTQFISAWVNVHIRDNYESSEKSLTLLHYNAETKAYVSQQMF
jgi:hypothetical protein